MTEASAREVATGREAWKVARSDAQDVKEVLSVSGGFFFVVLCASMSCGARDAVSGTDERLSVLADLSMAEVGGRSGDELGPRERSGSERGGDTLSSDVCDSTELAGPDERSDMGTADEDTSKADVCVPNCLFKTCGDDGCGGTCGKCTLPGARCVAAGICVCEGSCEGKKSGDDDGCGEVCPWDVSLDFTVDVLWAGYWRETSDFIETLPCEQIGNRLQVVGETVLVDWLAVTYNECTIPESAGLIIKGDEIHVGVSGPECPYEGLDCIYTDNEIVSNVHSEFHLEPGSYQVIVECGASGVFCGIDCGSETFSVEIP